MTSSLAAPNAIATDFRAMHRAECVSLSPVHLDESAWLGRPYSYAFSCLFCLFALFVWVGSRSTTASVSRPVVFGEWISRKGRMERWAIGAVSRETDGPGRA